MLVHQCARTLLKTHSPIKRIDLVTTPRIRVKVVRKIAASDDEHTCITQTREPRAELIMKGGWLSLIDAELNHGDVGFWKDVTENRPGAMVQSPLLVQPDLDRC